jgi:hypothetical protein
MQGRSCRSNDDRPFARRNLLGNSSWFLVPADAVSTKESATSHSLTSATVTYNLGICPIPTRTTCSAVASRLGQRLVHKPLKKIVVPLSRSLAKCQQATFSFSCQPPCCNCCCQQQSRPRSSKHFAMDVAHAKDAATTFVKKAGAVAADTIKQVLPNASKGDDQLAHTPLTNGHKAPAATSDNSAQQSHTLSPKMIATRECNCVALSLSCTASCSPQESCCCAAVWWLKGAFRSCCCHSSTCIVGRAALNTSSRVHQVPMCISSIE